MRIVLLFALTFILLNCKNNTTVPQSHPLKHPQFKIIAQPRGDWVDGWLYIHEVMDYIFKSKSEKIEALSKLSKIGYGPNKSSFLIHNDRNISVNGNIFSNISSALDFIQKNNLKRVLYVTNTSFPRQIPENIKIPGVDFWVLDHRK